MFFRLPVIIRIHDSGGHIDFPCWDLGAQYGVIGCLGRAPCAIYSAGYEWGWEDRYLCMCVCVCVFYECSR